MNRKHRDNPYYQLSEDSYSCTIDPRNQAILSSMIRAQNRTPPVHTLYFNLMVTDCVKQLRKQHIVYVFSKEQIEAIRARMANIELVITELDGQMFALSAK